MSEPLEVVGAIRPGRIPFRSGLAALLALVLLGASATPALGIGVIPDLVIRPEKNPHFVCVGQNVELMSRVGVTLLGAEFGGIKPVGPFPLVPAVKVGDTRIVTVTHKKAQPKDNYGEAEPYQGERYDLKGIKPGMTTVTFTATFPPGWRGDQNDRDNPFRGTPARTLIATKKIDVTVDKCDYKVGAVHILGGPGGIWTAVIDDVTITADDDGQVTGSGDVAWASGVPVFPDCEARTSFTPSGVEIIGEIGDDGLLSLNFVHEASSFEHVVESCSDPHHLTGDVTASIELPPLDTAFPAEGGSLLLHPHVAGLPAGSYTVVITAEPIPEPAVVAVRTPAER